MISIDTSWVSGLPMPATGFVAASVGILVMVVSFVTWNRKVALRRKYARYTMEITGTLAGVEIVTDPHGDVSYMHSFRYRDPDGGMHSCEDIEPRYAKYGNVSSPIALMIDTKSGKAVPARAVREASTALASAGCVLGGLLTAFGLAMLVAMEL